MSWDPNYEYLVEAARNRRPERLPIYEHHIAPEIVAQGSGVDMAFPGERSSIADYRLYYANQARFWRDMTYDAIDFEAAIVGCWDNSGAIMGGKPGPIQNRADFESFPFDEVPDRFWRKWTPHLEAMYDTLPAGMKAVGGCGYGVFEISEDLVGFEYLCLLQFDDPGLFADLYRRIGDLVVSLWTRMLKDYGDLFCICRMGDDLGYRSSTLLRPETIRQHILPQYRRVIDLVHAAGKPFLMHSCGRIFAVMEDLIAAGIDAKHSNEDAIAPFDEWIRRYGARIGLFGGIDVDSLCRQSPEAILDEVVRKGSQYRQAANGYALGSGNSIPDYVPLEGFQALIAAAQEIRRSEARV
jgi:uroporphyrinogen decarboxylase